MTYEEALAFLESRKVLGMQLGLERMHEALRLCENVHKRLRVVHIAGTNGKGSTAQLLAGAMSFCGYRVGVFSSPPLNGVCEVMCLDGKPIEKEAFATVMGRVAALPVPLTEYECLAVAALLWFYEQRIDLCVIECCMGGLTDATNVFDAPLATVFTPIALDHTAFLGETVEAIAEQKCGIMRAGCDVICSPGQSPEALGVIMERAAVLGCRVMVPCVGASPLSHNKGGNVSFLYGEWMCRLQLRGAFQRDNALTALEVLSCLKRKGFPLDTRMALQGMSLVTMPCRQELVCEEPPVMMDAAHNPHGIAALCETVRDTFTDLPVTAVWGMLRDKDVDACVQLLAPLCRRVICCTPESPRALKAEELAAKIAAIGVEALVCEVPQEAFCAALHYEGACLVCGSFYLCGPLRPFILEMQQK